MIKAQRASVSVIEQLAAELRAFADLVLESKQTQKRPQYEHVDHRIDGQILTAFVCDFEAEEEYEVAIDFGEDTTSVTRWFAYSDRKTLEQPLRDLKCEVR